MSTQTRNNLNPRPGRFVRVLSAALITTLAPPIGRAGAASPDCRALVSVANDLYLVSPAGTMIARFTSDGAAKVDAAVSPDGSQVAYVAASSDETNIEQYDVADASARLRSFPVNSESSRPESPNFDAVGPLMGLWWNADDVLSTIKHVSPGSSLFEFHRIDLRLGDRPPILGTGSGTGCAMKRAGEQVACVQGADIWVGDQDVFYDSGFPATPIASFTLTKGNSVTTPGNPVFTVAVAGFRDGEIGLNVSPPAGGAGGGTEYLGTGDFNTIWWNGVQYGFSATLVSGATGLVQVQEFQGRGAGTSIFDSAVAWQPQGQGLLVIRRENGQAILYLIEPRDWTDSEDGGGGRRWGGSGGDLNQGNDHAGRNSWILAARTPVNMPKSVQTMRFVTPSVLLFQTEDGAFSWAPIQMSNGPLPQSEGAGSGAPILNVGAITQLPSAVPATINGSASQATALGWSCSASGAPRVTETNDPSR